MPGCPQHPPVSLHAQRQPGDAEQATLVPGGLGQPRGRAPRSLGAAPPAVSPRHRRPPWPCRRMVLASSRALLPRRRDGQRGCADPRGQHGCEPGCRRDPWGAGGGTAAPPPRGLPTARGRPPAVSCQGWGGTAVVTGAQLPAQPAQRGVCGRGSARLQLLSRALAASSGSTAPAAPAASTAGSREPPPAQRGHVPPRLEGWSQRWGPQPAPRSPRWVSHRQVLWLLPGPGGLASASEQGDGAWCCGPAHGGQISRQSLTPWQLLHAGNLPTAAPPCWESPQGEIWVKPPPPCARGGPASQACPGGHPLPLLSRSHCSHFPLPAVLPRVGPAAPFHGHPLSGFPQLLLHPRPWGNG